jgi:hypothetical protein
MDPPRKSKKCIKKREGPINLTLGDDIKLNEIVTMQNTTLVGRFASKRASPDSLKAWTATTFATFLGYAPSSLVLAKGWLAWTFRSEQDASAILSGRWCYGTQALFLKRWTPEFNASTARQEITPIWVRLPGLPISFWTEEIFHKIGSTLGHFYEADLSYKTTGYMAMAHILVGLKLTNGLALHLHTTSWAHLHAGTRL